MRLRDVALRIIGGKREEQRAIDAVPWDHGGPTRPSIVSSEQALGLVPVFAAVRLLASQVASLPLQNYRKTGDLRQRIPAPSLFIQPSVHGTLYDWLHRCVTSLALRGNAYGLITQRDRDQYPTMIEWLHPDDIWCDDRQASGPGSYTNPLWYWQGRLIPAEDLLHIPWFTIPGRVQGLSPIGACAATISTGISAQNYTSDWFDNGAVPPGEFRNKEKTVNQTEADIISARLNAAIRRRKPLVYGNDWEYKPISVSAHEAKFIETSKMTATQVAAIYGIPPEMIGGESGGPLTYNTVEQNTLNFVKFTLQPWLVLLEGAFFGLMPRPQYIKFNVDALLRSDLQTRMSAYTAARQIGLQNTDEQRALEDLPPLPNGQGQDYTPLPILLKQAGPQPAEVRNPPREVEVIRTYGYPRGPLSGPEALLELVGRRHDPADPAAMAAPVTRKFDPTQPRNPHSGEWIDTTPGDGAVGALKDALKLAGRIQLEPDEKLVGSDKVSGYGGNVLMALIERDGERTLRLGIGDDIFGGRDDEAGPWRATPSIGDNPSGYTAKLDLPAAVRLHTALTEGMAAARADKAVNGDGVFGRTFAEGSVPGEWADVHYSVYVDDPDLGLRVVLGAVPHNSGRSLSDLAGYEQAATLDPAETRRLLRLLARYTGEPARNLPGHADTRAADLNPGGEQLKHYWLHGEGAVKWSTFTELYHHLVKHMSPPRAKRIAAEWFHERYGFWPGADLNRVKHGKPPRGDVVGPG